MLVAGRDHLVVPYTLDANDMRFATANGFANGEEFFAYLRDSFDTLYAEGERAPWWPFLTASGASVHVNTQSAAKKYNGPAALVPEIARSVALAPKNRA